MITFKKWWGKLYYIVYATKSLKQCETLLVVVVVVVVIKQL